MRVKVDTKNDTLYFRLDENPVVESEEVSPGVILDYDAQDNVIGLELLHISKRISPEKLKQFQFESA